MAKLLRAKEVNRGIEAGWQMDLQKLKEEGVTPKLAMVRLGTKGPDLSYEKGIIKKMDSYGLAYEAVVFPEDVDEDRLIQSLEALGRDSEIHGILLFQPLPEGMDERRVKEAINPIKDVDCATAYNLGATMAGWPDGYAYCAPAAVMEVLKFYGIPVKGKNVCIIGSGLVVGKPLAMLLVNALATVSLTNVFTEDVSLFSRKADILISAAGVPGLVDETYVREGQVVIDVGTTYEGGKLKGDVNREKVEPIVAALTPTPGGISGITTTILAQHLIQAAKELTFGGRREK
ncbi:bifunctional 5,10-methylenetetrahydrofolate dehydrogenase/5,10-methenyltetrahydrofolate cyclohydrolase [Kallipyga gabonensis]|uniref:bifunctional 5,10-methylenetetrahydrofolate dehydrogenase/5,10-methenyltetrahydrofolate cyclohydrolase n=1 Tax=Kallipyga gabonensis TaxID=1686287 RepID=UPI0006B449B9|nr:bifunctional 5,10-methylenetetrahydrofolate dehydrogenase/5,10-methenyltetrahydrofolate cyclohydrolase [Kallipyga gabonensis]